MGDQVPGSRRGAVAGLLLVVALVVGGIWLMRHLRATAALQDCVMSGRTNCAPIASGGLPNKAVRRSGGAPWHTDCYTDCYRDDIAA